jgi:hypothetical protein
MMDQSPLSWIQTVESQVCEVMGLADIRFLALAAVLSQVVHLCMPVGSAQAEKGTGSPISGLRWSFHISCFICGSYSSFANLHIWLYKRSSDARRCCNLRQDLRTLIQERFADCLLANPKTYCLGVRMYVSNLSSPLRSHDIRSCTWPNEEPVSLAFFDCVEWNQDRMRISRGPII